MLAGRVCAADLSSEANRAFGLQRNEIARLHLPGTLDRPVSIPLQFDGVTGDLVLHPHSVRSQSFRVLAQRADGSFEEVTPAPVRTFRGEWRGRPGSVVAAHVDEAGLHARILLPDRRQAWIEPLAARVPGAQRGDHVVYRQEDVVGCGGQCLVREPGEVAPSRAGTAAVPATETAVTAAAAFVGVKITELSTDADYEYFQRWGSVAAVENRIESIINAVNIQYERDVGISHLLGTILVRTAEPDPYDTNDPDIMLDEFREDWIANHADIHRDVAQLFTGKNLLSNTIGLAFQRTVCSTFAFSVVESDHSSSFSCVTDLTAHELGHSWGADHCTCPGTTMYPLLECANVFDPVASIPFIVDFRDSRPCLDDPVLLPPSGLTAEAVSSQQINLAWVDNTAIESGFKIERATSSSGPWTQVKQLGANVTSYSDTGLVVETTYYYRVRAFNSLQNSDYSNVASARTVLTGLRGEYFDNADLTNRKLSRVDASVNFDWGYGTPDSSIGVDSFSVRWTGWIVPRYTQTYTFCTVTDDGARLWIGNNLLINDWTNHAAKTNTATAALVAGQRYPLRLEYYDNTSGASVKLLWSSASQPKEVVPTTQLYPAPTGILADYFAGTSLSTQKLSRVDANVNFDWGYGMPDSSVGSNFFSARWSGALVPKYTQTYTLYTISDDGVRLWVDGNLVITNWRARPVATNSTTLNLVAGQRHVVKMEYFENTSAAVARLQWLSASQSREAIPTGQLMPAETGLLAEYFVDKSLATQMVTRVDASVDFDWGYTTPGRPDPSVGTDGFSARWTGTVIPRYTENHTFYTVTDDGVRLWVNGNLVIDDWANQPLTTNTAVAIALVAGQPCDIRMEYYENTSGAVAKLLWSSPSLAREIIPTERLRPAPTGLQAAYFADTILATQKVARVDSQVEFDWGYTTPGTPDPLVPVDLFSARWTGQLITRATGNYTFHTVSDDGVRLWVNGAQIINNWTPHAPTTNSSSPVALVAGRRYDVQLDYFENRSGAVIKLLWTPPGQSLEVIPSLQLRPSAITSALTVALTLAGSTDEPAQTAALPGVHVTSNRKRGGAFIESGATVNNRADAAGTAIVPGECADLSGKWLVPATGAMYALTPSAELPCLYDVRCVSDNEEALVGQLLVMPDLRVQAYFDEACGVTALNCRGDYDPAEQTLRLCGDDDSSAAVVIEAVRP